MSDNKYARVLKWIFFIVAFLMLLFVVVFLFTGCVDKQELEELSVVSGIAVDQGEYAGGLSPVSSSTLDRGQTPGVKLTVEIVAVSSEGTTGKDIEGQNLQLKGEDPFSALRAALNTSQNKLYITHNQVLIFSSKLAEQGLREHVDFFVRDYEARLNVPMLIAEGEAAEILQTKIEGSGLTAEYLSNMIEDQSEQGINIHTKMLNFTSNIVSWEKGTLIPMVKLQKKDEKSQIVIDGTAAFAGDTMVGTLDGGQTRGVLWVMGLVKDGLVPVETSQGSVEVEITGSKVSQSIDYKDGRVVVKVKILQSGIIGSATQGAGYNYEKNIEEIQKATEKAIKQEIENGYRKLAELKCDAYGFGDQIRRSHGDIWKEVCSNWEEVFQNIDFNIEVESTIDNTGALRKDL